MKHLLLNTSVLMRDKGLRLAKSLLWAALFTLLILLPELIFSHLWDGFSPYLDSRVILVIYLINLFAVNARSHRLSLLIIAGLYALQLSALLYFRYAGVFYSPADVMLFFFDAKEVFSSLFGIAQFIVLPCVVALILYGMHVKWSRKAHESALQSRVCAFILLLLLAAPAVTAKFEDNSQKYQPDATNFAIRNALYSVSYFLGKDLPMKISGNYQMKHYPAYQVSTAPSLGQYHVIVVMGESLTSTHMNLFGYPRATTPFLNSLATDGKLFYRPSISAAVSTRVSVPMFMNVQYEADNWSHITSQQSSLFKLAKQSGYQTAFISTQMMDGTSSLMGGRAIDYWKDQRDKGQCAYDNCLVNLMQQTPINWTKPAFVVLNQRSAHSPYDKNYPAEFALFSKQKSNDYRQFKVDSYDDSVRYVDHNLETILKHLRSQTRLPIILILTSDHGEMVGEDGRFGHNILELSNAKVPFVMTLEHVPQTVIEEANRLPAVVPHYEAARFVARLLGYQISAPSQEPNRYYLNGVDLMGLAGFRTYQLDEVN